MKFLLRTRSCGLSTADKGSLFIKAAAKLPAKEPIPAGRPNHDHTLFLPFSIFLHPLDKPDNLIYSSNYHGSYYYYGTALSYRILGI